MQHVPQNPEEEFNFYMKFAKSLVLNLPDPIEKSRAASWLKKLKSVTDPESAALKNDYLKLLLFVLQRKRLVGPFEQMPDYDAPLEPFPDKQGLLEVAKQLIALEAKIEEVACGEPNPYMVAVSSDLKEYSVAQEFNKCGAHCYYAISGEAITGWRDADKGQFPRGARSHEESIFDTSAPTKSKCALQYEQLDHTCAEKCAGASAQVTQRKAATEAKAQKNAVDSYRWLDRTDEPAEKTGIDWDPLEGRVEIDKHLEMMSRTLEELTNDSFMKGSRDGRGRGAAPTPQDAAISFDRNVDDVFGEKFYGSVASVKKTCSTEKNCSDGRQVISQAITQGHSVVSRDALDGGVTQIHKNMSIYDGRRQGTVQEGADYRSSGREVRGERSPTQPSGQKGSRLPRRQAAPRPSAQAYNDDNATDRRDRGTRRCPAQSRPAPRHQKSRHDHFEPSPDETIDLTTTENDSSEQISLHRLAPGIDQTVEITTLHKPQRQDDRYQSHNENQSQYHGTQAPRPALRKLNAPPSQAPQRGTGSADQCPSQCGAGRRDARSSRGPR